MGLGNPYDLSSGDKGYKAIKNRNKSSGPVFTRVPSYKPNYDDHYDIATRILHDPDFDPALLLHKMLTNYINYYIRNPGVEKDELDKLIDRYLHDK